MPAAAKRRDLYEVLGVPSNCEEQEIKSAYRRLALKYHPDKNQNDPVAADTFKEITYSYHILSDPDKRHHYDTVGLQAIDSEGQELELDLSSLGALNTMLAAFFSKLGVPIKTTISATVLEEALNGSVPIRPLEFGKPLRRKVEKQCAHFYSVFVTDRESQMGLVCRVRSRGSSKFKLLYFEQDRSGGLSLALQEDSTKTGKVSSAGMFFLRFPVYRFDQPKTISFVKDPDAAFFKKLDGFQPCEISELKVGMHYFAVYGDNFFSSANYTIEILCGEAFYSEKEELRDVEAKILAKRAEISKFQCEYRQVLAQFTDMTKRYAQEVEEIDELLRKRNMIHAAYTSVPPPLSRSSSSSKPRSSSSRGSTTEEDESREKEAREKKPRDGWRKKKWFKLHLRVSKRKPC